MGAGLQLGGERMSAGKSSAPPVWNYAGDDPYNSYGFNTSYIDNADDMLSGVNIYGSMPASQATGEYTGGYGGGLGGLGVGGQSNGYGGSGASSGSTDATLPEPPLTDVAPYQPGDPTGGLDPAAMQFPWRMDWKKVIGNTLAGTATGGAFGGLEGGLTDMASQYIKGHGGLGALWRSLFNGQGSSGGITADYPSIASSMTNGAGQSSIPYYDTATMNYFPGTGGGMLPSQAGGSGYSPYTGGGGLASLTPSSTPGTPGAGPDPSTPSTATYTPPPSYEHYGEGPEHSFFPNRARGGRIRYR